MWRDYMADPLSCLTIIHFLTSESEQSMTTTETIEVEEEP